MLSPDVLLQLAEPVVKIAVGASREIMSYYRDENAQVIQKKADNSLVTAADLAAHHYIVTQLAQLTPAYPIISEESTGQLDIALLQSTPFWLVDPLDGTREFIHATDEFSINIALIVNAAPVLGLIHLPAYRETYFACKTAGCFKLVGDAFKPIHTKSWRTEQPCVVTMSRRHGVDALTTFIERLPNVVEYKAGSAYKFCLLAEGKVDLYPRFSPTMSWDTAAGQCLVEEAGGCVLTLTGERLSYTNPYQKNGHFHAFADEKARPLLFK